jgi:D-xylose 1-dehydrogenase (NADP+, D-xylono-1,5-lactone-forming)
MERILRWGILGTASIATTFANAIALSNGNRIEAISSRNPSSAKAWAEDRNVPHAFGSYEEMLRSGCVDAVYNPLPNSLHAEWTIQALDAGLPVLCEKPIAVNADEAGDIQSASKRTGLPVVEAFMYRHHPVYEEIIKMLREGAIGRVVSIDSAFNWLLDDRAQIPASAELAGGALMDVGCYPINVSRMLAGCEPTRVCAFERRASVDDTLIGLLDFPNGILARIECSIETEEKRHLEIKGTGGSMVLDNPWHPGDTESRIHVTRYGKEEVLAGPGANCYTLEIEEFARVVHGESTPRWTLTDAIANMSVIDALYRSAREGRAVSI